MDPQDKWLNTEKLSGYLNKSRSKPCQITQKGEQPGSRTGTGWRFDRERIDSWMKERLNTTRKAGAQHA